MMIPDETTSAGISQEPADSVQMPDDAPEPTLDALVPEGQKAVAVRPSDRLAEALETMIAKDFSQLPVVDEDGKVMGILTMAGIGQAVLASHRGRKQPLRLGRMRVSNFMETAVTVQRQEDFAAVLERLHAASAVVVVDDRNRPTAVITPWDSTRYLHEDTEAVRLLRDIENTLRQCIGDGLSSDEAEALATALEDYQPHQARRKIESVKDLSFGHYPHVITHDELWPRFGNLFEDKQFVDNALANVAEIRNKVLHWRGAATAGDLQKLRCCRQWLENLTRYGSPDLPADGSAERVAGQGQ